MPIRKDKRMMVFRTVVIAVIVLIVGAIALVNRQAKTEETGVQAPLAQCLTDKGVKMYGAYWCPHCAKQKKLFGGAFSKVTYVECGVPGESSHQQTKACDDAKIQSYPTWIFPDGSRVTGEQELESLAKKAGCPWNGASSDTAAPAAEGGASTTVVPTIEPTPAPTPGMLVPNTPGAEPPATDPGTPNIY
jgi:glutaredoxin